MNGYREFFERHGELCEPRAYAPEQSSPAEAAAAESRTRAAWSAVNQTPKRSSIVPAWFSSFY